MPPTEASASATGLPTVSICRSTSSNVTLTRARVFASALIAIIIAMPTSRTPTPTPTSNTIAQSKPEFVLKSALLGVAHSGLGGPIPRSADFHTQELDRAHLGGQTRQKLGHPGDGGIVGSLAEAEPQHA